MESLGTLSMFTRLAAALCSIFFLTACEQEASKNICKGLSETDCAAKSHCEWNAKKDECRKKKERAPAAEEPAAKAPVTPETPAVEEPAPEAPAAPEAAPSAETPPAAEPAPSEPSMGEPPSPSQPQPVYPDGPGPRTGPETGPGDTPPQ